MKSIKALTLLGLIGSLAPLSVSSAKKIEQNLKPIEKANILKVEASSEGENKKEFAIDKDYESYWEAKEKTNQTLNVELKEVSRITSIVQVFKDEDIWYFNIEASLDGINYFEIVNYQFGQFGNIFQESVDTFAKYLRLNVVKSEKGFNPSSIEFKVNTENLTRGSNLLHNAKAVANSESNGYEAYKAIDGNSGTFFCARDNNYPVFLDISLRNPSFINEINLHLQDFGSYEFELIGIKENGEEVVLASKAKRTGINFYFETKNVLKAIKYKVYSGPGWANLNEIEAYGFERIKVNKNQELKFDNPAFISKIDGLTNELEYKLGNEAYKKINLVNGKANVLADSLRTCEDVFAYCESLTKNLIEGLSGTCSDYFSHDYLLSNVTKDNESHWKGSTKGREETISFDLGRVSLLKKIDLDFLPNETHQYKVESSLDGHNYRLIIETNVSHEFVKNELNNSILKSRYLRITITPKKELYPSLRYLNINGIGNPLKENWWEREAGVIRFYPKLQEVTLNEITSRLDEFRHSGYKIIELHQPYEGLADIWAGLGGTNNYKVDPVIGTLDDLEHLINEAHKRGIYVFMFGNVGYGKDTADYFKKACRDYALGIESRERNWFVFSDTCPDPSKWFYSDIAKAYYYGFWGENGQIPTFNFENKEWQEEVYNYIDFWSDFGIDGIALDAPDVYYFGKADASKVTYETITKTLIRKNMFALPEGSADNKFIKNYHYNCVQNYQMSSWGGGAFSTGLNNAITRKKNNVGDVVKNNRDNTVSLGGVSMATMNFEDRYLNNKGYERVLEAALVTSTGHLSFLHSGSDKRIGQDIMLDWDQNIQNDVARLFSLQNSLGALNPTGHRYDLTSTNPDQIYSFVKTDILNNSTVIPIFNYGLQDRQVQIILNNTDIKLSDGEHLLYDAFSKETIKVTSRNNIITLNVKKQSYRCLVME